MDYTVIQEQVNRLSDAMIAKGLREPSAKFSLVSHAEPSVYLTWKPLKKKSLYGSDEYEFFRGDTIGEMLAKAFAFVEALPSPEEYRFREFMGALGSVIDLGKENGIETDYLKPLRATMKRLSENALTDQRVS